MREKAASAVARGILVISPTIPGMASLRLSDRLKSTFVPRLPKIAEPSRQCLRKAINEPMVQAEAKSNAPERSQGNVVSGQIHTPKSIHFFEVTQTVTLLLAISKVFIHQIRNPVVRAA